MTRLETLQNATHVLNLVNTKAIHQHEKIVYLYKVDETNLVIVIKSGILFKPELDKIDYLYIEYVDNELRIQF